ncbi:hypothetical protein PVK06_027911 [Gossypium arboreum]|uniref:Uncharacterized protein n=1 Tax=Gossypium arboreum TaxID=29729 RepID=A0ABR0P1H9_GOSAR|nr:hypothetical protein PVK06_027911 [Gossypium arboreum]
MLIPRALSSDKVVYENNGWLLPSTAVLGIILNTISGTNEPPNTGHRRPDRATIKRFSKVHDIAGGGSRTVTLAPGTSL